MIPNRPKGNGWWEITRNTHQEKINLRLTDTHGVYHQIWLNSETAIELGDRLEEDGLQLEADIKKKKKQQAFVLMFLHKGRLHLVGTRKTEQGIFALANEKVPGGKAIAIYNYNNNSLKYYKILEGMTNWFEVEPEDP